MRLRAAPAALVLGALVAASCIGGPGNAGTAWLRNESSQPVEVSIDFPSHGYLGGTNHLAIHLLPWQKGWCYALGEGVNPGSVTIAVSGPSMAFPISTTITVPASPFTDIGVLVDSAAEVHFSKAAPPPENAPCEGYPQILPSSSP